MALDFMEINLESLGHEKENSGFSLHALAS